MSFLLSQTLSRLVRAVKYVGHNGELRRLASMNTTFLTGATVCPQPIRASKGSLCYAERTIGAPPDSKSLCETNSSIQDLFRPSTLNQNVAGCANIVCCFSMVAEETCTSGYTLLCPHLTSTTTLVAGRRCLRKSLNREGVCCCGSAQKS